MLEILTVSLALTMMAIVVFGKLYFAQSIGKMRHQIAMVDQEKGKILGHLKAISAQKSVAEIKRNTLSNKKSRLEKRLIQVKNELKEIAAEEGKRQNVRDTMRGKLIRNESGDVIQKDEVEEETP